MARPERLVPSPARVDRIGLGGFGLVGREDPPHDAEDQAVEAEPDRPLEGEDIEAGCVLAELDGCPREAQDGGALRDRRESCEA